jgi:phosphate transport system permease protein
MASTEKTPATGFLRQTGRPGKFWKQGEPMVWATGAALTLMLLMTATLLIVILVNGLGVFWPAQLAHLTLTDGTKLLGRQMSSATNPDNNVRSIQYKTANREFDPKRQDFHYVPETKIGKVDYPAGAMVVERAENGDFYGFLKELNTPTLEVPAGAEIEQRFAAAVKTVERQWAEIVDPIAAELSELSDKLQRIDRSSMKAEYQRTQLLAAGGHEDTIAKLDARLQELKADHAEIDRQSQQIAARQKEKEASLRRNVAVFADAQGQLRTIVLADVVRYYRPNTMGLPAKISHYAGKIWELLSARPRESNTEGGLFPAIFGTVMLIFLMALSCFPLGVLAGIYLGEYAREGMLVRLVRIAVNNLAGIPSIVYGIFGMGFFIYGIGALLDQWLYPERVAHGSPTFGTGGILWASLTLGLLTVPVVIVATEEAIRSIPRGIRESSYALGATKFQTLLRVLLPVASPGIMTGFILAMARAAGEVAPLMITGVVKLAPTMPLDGTFPYFHLDRKFMHLGFHIYDIGFQSPNVEATKPMVYVTTLLLVLIVLLMSSLAIYLRNRMRKHLQMRMI